jgi:hypothetical protein
VSSTAHPGRLRASGSSTQAAAWRSPSPYFDDLVPLAPELDRALPDDVQEGTARAGRRERSAAPQVADRQRPRQLVEDRRRQLVERGDAGQEVPDLQELDFHDRFRLFLPSPRLGGTPTPGDEIAMRSPLLLLAAPGGSLRRFQACQSAWRMSRVAAPRAR